MCLGAVVLVLALAGTGPLGAGDQSAKAKDDCRTRAVTRSERIPSVVFDSQGQPKIVYTRRPAHRLERDCR